MARKPAALARELLRNFPKGRRGSKRRRRKTPGGGDPANRANGAGSAGVRDTELEEGQEPDRDDLGPDDHDDGRDDERDEPGPEDRDGPGPDARDEPTPDTPDQRNDDAPAGRRPARRRNRTRRVKEIGRDDGAESSTHEDTEAAA
jgi:hypothetical protein